VLIHPRVALASGLAAAAGAIIVILGRLDGSVLLVAALAVGCRAAALAASSEPFAAASLARQVAVAPVWAGLAVVAAMRAGTVMVDGVRGAHAVAGVGLLRGDPLTVAALWTAGVAALLALLAPSLRERVLVTGAPANRLEAVAIAVQVSVIVALLAGPQVTGVADLIPWALAVVAIGSVVVVGRRIASIERAGSVAVVLAGIAVVLALVGEAP